MLNGLHLQNFRQGVYEALKLAILRCDVLPGQRLVERELIQQIGRSRTPLREAIIKLEQEGLVSIHPGKAGYFVSLLSKRDLEEVFAIREILETYCAGLVVDRISQRELHNLEQITQEEDLYEKRGDLNQLIELDTRFHEVLYNACGNRKLCEILTDLKKDIYRLRALSYKSKGRKTVHLSSHKKLLLALKRKDKQKFVKLTRETILRSKEILLGEFLQGGINVDRGDCAQSNSAE